VGLGRRLTRQEEIPDTDLQGANGSGYELTVTGFDQQGNPVAARKVALGGGAKWDIPDLAEEEGKAPVGPTLDDEDVPRRSEGNNGSSRAKEWRGSEPEPPPPWWQPPREWGGDHPKAV
jgi:hypothetical protein